MSGRGEDRGEGVRVALRGVLVVIVIAAALGVFGSRSGFERPKLGAVNIAGIAIMFIGLLTTMLSATLAGRASAERQPVIATALKLGGVLVCCAGGLMVFL